MDKTIQFLNDFCPFESSSETTKEFATYARVFKSDITKHLASLGAELVTFSRGHFTLSGFFKKDDQMYYFSQVDVRYGNPMEIMIRTAKSEKDYRGGTNNWTKLGPNLFSKLPA